MKTGQDKNQVTKVWNPELPLIIRPSPGRREDGMLSFMKALDLIGLGGISFYAMNSRVDVQSSDILTGFTYEGRTFDVEISPQGWINLGSYQIMIDMDADSWTNGKVIAECIQKQLCEAWEAQYGEPHLTATGQYWSGTHPALNIWPGNPEYRKYPPDTYAVIKLLAIHHGWEWVKMPKIYPFVARHFSGVGWLKAGVSDDGVWVRTPTPNKPLPGGSFDLIERFPIGQPPEYEAFAQKFNAAAETAVERCRHDPEFCKYGHVIDK